MIEEYFRSERVRGRLEQSRLGPAVFEDLVRHLAERGHPHTTIQQYVQAVEHFDQWLRRTRRWVGDVDETTIQGFLRRHLPRCSCPAPCCRTLYQARAALNHLLAVLRQTRRVPTKRVPSGVATTMRSCA